MLKVTNLFIVILLMIWQTTFGQTIPTSLYVVNTTGENLSFINLDTQGVNTNAATLGLYTNQIKISGNKGYVVNSGVNEVQVIDLHTLATIDNIHTGTGTNPYAMDFINDSLAAVSLLFTNEVAIINLISGQVVHNVSVGGGPEGVKYYNGKIYVTNTGFNGTGYDPGTVSVIDAISLNVVNTINVGINPQSAEVDTNGNLIVACTGNYVSVFGQVDMVDLSADTVFNSLNLNSSITSVFVNSDNKLYISTFGFGIMVYNLTTQIYEKDEANPLPGGPGVAFDNQNNCYIVDFSADSVRAYSENHTHLKSYLVGDGPVSADVYDTSVNLIPEGNFILPEKMVLYQNYPNPFNPETQIGFYLPQRGDVHLKVFNMLGQEIYSIFKNDVNAGYNTIGFDGSKFSSGAYFYQLKSANNLEMKRMILIK